MTTQDLKTLLDQATDRPTPFVPDLDQLLTGGRRRARTHFVVGTVATLAAVGVAATAGVFALNQGGGTAPGVVTPPPAGQESAVAQPKPVIKCVNDADNFLPAAAGKWPAIISVKDQYGISTIRRSKGQLAFCSEAAPGISGAVRQTGLPNAAEWLIGACNQKTDPACPGIVTAFMGRLPAKAVRVTVTPTAGKPVDAAIRDGFFIYRGIGKPDFARPATARLYDAAGHELAKYTL